MTATTTAATTTTSTTTTTTATTATTATTTIITTATTIRLYLGNQFISKQLPVCNLYQMYIVHACRFF